MGSRASKRVIDVVACLVAAPLVLVVCAVVAVAVRLSMGSPVLFRQKRAGLHGQVFELLKFRTMTDERDESGRLLPDDKRLTRLGKFLRSTSLDELPQLWNVLRGEMSLVGPRPVVREELMRYGRNAAFYLSVKPGLTGLWQVTGRNDVSYRRRVVLDVYYIRKQNLLLDCYILFKTPSVVFGGGGAY